MANEPEYRGAKFENHQIIARGTIIDAATGAYSEEMLTWDRIIEKKIYAGQIIRVVMRQTGGDAVTFDAEIRSSEAGAGLAVVYAVRNITTIHDVAPPSPVPFNTQQTGNKRGYLWVAIYPVGGTGGDYEIEIIAEPKR